MQLKNLRFLFALLFTVSALSALSLACGDLEEDCDPETDENCECETDEETGEEVCTTANNSSSNNSSSNNSSSNNSTANNSTANNSSNNSSGPEYRFVMVEDESTDNLNGGTPGADVDAIGVDVDGDGVVDNWATSVEDSNIGGAGNEYADTSELLGEPDADCMVQNFTSLGGAGANGDNYVIVGFSGGSDVTFGAGSVVLVWELGPTNCPNQASWKDDENTISVSVSSDRASFTRIGTVGTGTNAVIIP